jgi:type IV pilus assembly protein PilC
MLVTGERTGRLGPMMQNVANYYEEEQSTLIKQMKSLIEPIMIVFIAVMVGIILLSVIVPMFSMYDSI